MKILTKLFNKIFSKLKWFFIRHKVSPQFDEYHAKHIQTGRKYMARNFDRLKLYNKEWHRKHSKEVSERKRKWYAEHKAEVKDYYKKWLTDNPDKVKGYVERQALKRKEKGNGHIQKDI